MSYAFTSHLFQNTSGGPGGSESSQPLVLVMVDTHEPVAATVFVLAALVDDVLLPASRFPNSTAIRSSCLRRDWMSLSSDGGVLSGALPKVWLRARSIVLEDGTLELSGLSLSIATVLDGAVL